MAVDGTYTVAVEAFGNRAQGTVELRTEGTGLAGTVRAMGMDAQLQDGRTSGSSFTGSIEGPTPLGTKRFEVSGTVEGDRISGSLAAFMLSIPFEGTRA